MPMKKRKGYFLLDGLIGLLILSALSAALFPFAASALKASDRLTHRGRLVSEGMYAMDFMVEKTRNDLQAGGTSISSDAFSFKAYNQSDVVSTYKLYVDAEKLKLLLYTGSVEPVTGTTSGKETYAFREIESALVFQKAGRGPLEIGFQMHHQMSGEDADFHTRILSYTDFYRKGEAL